ncbi:aquaporin-11 [Heptranchias perlo]|uniref:aquaporin-11 n=1 Tax=Heptranchias perlo TaxID=212740 RepID=UPI00355A06C7
MNDLLVSAGVLAGTVTICEVLRRTAKELLHPRRRRGRQSRPDPLPLEVSVELFSTLQLCICTHELRLLGCSGLLSGHCALGLLLTYLMTLVHVSSFGGASCNPVSCLEQFLRGQSSGAAAASKVLAQFTAASVARRLSEMVWFLDMSDIHVRHRQRQYECASALNATASSGAVVEFACAFALRTALFRFAHLEWRHKIHLVAAVVTFLVFAVGDLTGAMFNPALAYSITFNCEGNTFVEYSFVYWLGPLMGAMTAVMLFEEKLAPCTLAESETREANKKRN